MKFCISLPQDISETIIERLIEMRKENPRKNVSVSGVIAKHLKYAFEKPVCEVIKE